VEGELSEVPDSSKVSITSHMWVRLGTSWIGAHVPTEPQPEPKAETAPQKVTILPRPGSDTEPRPKAPHDEGICKMERALQGIPHPQKVANLRPGPRTESATDQSKQGVDAWGPYTLKRDPIGWYKAKPPHIAMISAIAFQKISRRRDKGSRHAAVTGITTLHEIDRILELCDGARTTNPLSYVVLPKKGCRIASRPDLAILWVICGPQCRCPADTP
jgi:hypothetical protein